ncbi:unconventional myosin-XVIIIb-like [Sinocyclocheilus grahami]|uniref:unconventional myosin-XVIIIb-like n=1 Tax=Sinocyclocheilus grahami TaxID=75366 RepID=UPI0007AD593D|nr:PREDICTED: unconventional myosin-XVIIIb-like [Sinocyclocheilus grahami]
MALSSRLKLWEQKIKEEKKPPAAAAATQPPPPLSAVPGGFLKQLVRETEKETRHKEPELKEEKTPRKLSDNLVQNFLLPDQTPPILEAEMALRAEQLVNGERGRHTALTEKKTSSPRRIMSPDPKNPKTGSKSTTPEVSLRTETAKSPAPPLEKEVKKEEVKLQQEVKPLKQEVQEPEGQITVTPIREKPKVPVRDVWYEAGKVWYAHKDGYTLATQLKPDEGTPELPDGRVRVRLDSDGSVHDVSQYEIEKLNPPELDLCEDLSDLVSVNESSVLHTVTSRAKGHLPLTHAGPNLLALWPPLSSPGKGLRSRHWESWEAPGPLQALVRRVYVSMVGQRRDQTLVALGRSGTGKTTSCQSFSQELLKQAGTAGGSLTLERLQAVFTVLRSFGCVNSSHSEASTRFAMVLSLDFNHAGLAAAAHLQTMLLEKWRVCQRPEGESNFLVFSQMLAGLSTDMRTELQLHQLKEHNSFGISCPTKTMLLEKWRVCQRPEGESNFLVFSQMLAGLSTDMRTELQLHQLKEHNSFGISCPTKVDEKQRASVGFGKLLAALNTLGFSADEQKAIWHVLAGIYHLGVAGTCKVGRKQFMSFDSAQTASAILGCEGEELHTAVFKHHLRQLLQRATGGVRERRAAEEPEDGPRLSAAQCVEGMAAGLYEELFTSIVSLINRALHSQQLTLASVIVVDTPGPRLSAAQCVEGMAAGLYEELFTSIVSLINRALHSQQLTLASVIVVDTPGLRNPRHSGDDRAAGFSELCHNYLQERLLEHYFSHTFTHTLERYTQEGVAVDFTAPETSPSEVVCAVDQPGVQVSLTDPQHTSYTRYPEHMSLGDFRCRFQALSAPIMKRYGSVFITPDERKVQQMAVSCIQRNVRVLTAVARWSWWKLLCRVRPLLDVNMDDQRLRSKEVRTTDTFTKDMFDSELTQALEQADNEREQKERAIQENTALGAEIFTLRKTLKESQVEVTHLQQQKEELCAQIRDLSVPHHLTSDSIPELKKKLRELETRDKERSDEISQMTARIKQQEQTHLRFEMEMERMKQIHQKELEDKDEELEDVQKSSQRRLRQLEMQLEQEYEEKQMVVHEKHDLEGLIATLCEQVGHRDFDVEKRLRRDLKRTHALLSDAQLLLSTVEQPGQGHDPGAKEQLERLCCQLEDSEARRLESESTQKTLAAELENAQIELESICKQKSLVDEQLAQLRYERTDLMKRLEEDQEDLNELMKKHKALIAQSSSDISQIRELQAEMEELKKQRQTLQKELQTSVARVQFLESSTVARSIVSKQEARICDLENKLEFQRGQVKRFEVLVLRLRDSVVRLGEELEQAAQAEARERENSRYYQQRLADMKLEMDDLSIREQESSRRRMELEMQVEELSAVRQTLQADLETSIRRIVDLQAALEEVESSDESDTESVQTAVESFSRRKDLDTMSSVGSSVGTEDVGEGIRQWAGVPRGGRTSPYAGSSSGRQSVTDTMSTYSFRSCTQDLDEDIKESSSGLGRASSSTALSELLEGLRKKRAGWERGSEAGEGSTVSLPIYQTTGASTLRRRSSALSLEAEEGLEDLPRPGILKPPSPHLPRASSLRSLSESGPTSSTSTTTTGKMNRFSSCDSLASVTSTASSRRHLSNLAIPEEGEEEPSSKAMPPLGTYQPIRHRLLGGLVAETGESQLGLEPLVFQNRRLLGNQDKERARVDARDTSSDILPAIRRAQSTSSLASSSSRTGQRRALSVHFGELPPSRASRRESDSDSSSSGGSQKRRGPQGERLEAEGSEDVNSVMKKYLKKAEVD